MCVGLDRIATQRPVLESDFTVISETAESGTIHVTFRR